MNMPTFQTVPLPQRVVPDPEEDLTSVIARTSRAMGYPNPRWVIQPTGSDHHIASDELPLLHNRNDYTMLGNLLALDEQTLYRHTLHRFASQFLSSQEAPQRADEMSIEYPLLRSTRLFWHQSTTRICPCCVDEQNPYDRLYWRASHLSLCPIHRVFLISQCPACHAPIPALRSHPSLCPVCRTGDYRAAVRPLLSESRWFYESNIVFLTHLGIELQEDEARLSTHASSLCQHFSSQEYLEFIERFWWLLHTPPMSASLLPFLRRVFPIEGRIPGVAAPSLLIHYILAEWPLHFWMVLDAFHQALRADTPRAKWLTEVPQRWEQSFVHRNPWRSEAALEQGDIFFETAYDYLNEREHSGRRDIPFGETNVSEGILLPDESSTSTGPERITPYPWEDLTSVICRAARLRHYPHPNWLLMKATPSPHKILSSDLPLLRKQEDYQLLQQQLSLPFKALFPLTIHRLTTALARTTRAAEGESFFCNIQSQKSLELAQEFCLPLDSTKVCPACLEGTSGYDRLFWRLRAVVLCPVHRLLLVVSPAQRSVPVL